MQQKYYHQGFQSITESDMEMGCEVRWAAHYRCTEEFLVSRLHKRYLLLYVIDGKGSAETTNGVRADINSGDVVFFSTFSKQILSIDKNQPFEFCGLSFSGSFFDNLISRTSIATMGLCSHTTGSYETLLQTCEEMIRLMTYNEAHNSVKILGLSISFIGEIEKLVRSKSSFATNGRKTPFQIEKTVKYMYDNYNKKINLDTIVELSGYSKSRFLTLFKQYYGCTPVHFLIDIRVRQARELLIHTFLNVSEVAYAVGYDDPMYFSKVFHKILGITPSEVRKSIKQ